MKALNWSCKGHNSPLYGKWDENTPTHTFSNCCGAAYTDDMENFNNPTNIDTTDYQAPFRRQRNRGILLGFNLEGTVEEVPCSVATVVDLAPNCKMFFRGHFRTDTPLVGELTEVFNPVNTPIEEIRFIYMGEYTTENFTKLMLNTPRTALLVFVLTRNWLEGQFYKQEYGGRVAAIRKGLVYESAYTCNFRYPTYAPKLKLLITKGFQ